MMLAVTAFAAAPAAAQDEPPTGGTAVVGEWQTATQLNPFLPNALKDFEASYPILRPLVQINDDGEWFTEFLVELPSIENDGVVLDEDGEGFTVNLKMKPDLSWSDGAPFTLHDYAWNLDWALSTAQAGVGCVYCLQFNPLIDPSLEGDALYAPENRYIESVEVSEDGLSAAVKYRQNYAGWIGQLNQPQLLPPQFWQDIPADEIASTAVPGNPKLLEMPSNGPFVISAASSEGIDYVPNPLFTADTGPYLDELRLRFYGSKDGEFTAFLNGEIDVTLNTTMADVKALQSVDPSIGRAQVDSGWLYEHLDFNHESSNVGLDDPMVRKGLRMGIDKQQLVDVLFPGAGLEPACSVSPPTVWWASDVACDPYDPEGAAALLDEAGWVFDPDLGVRAKDGNPMRLRMCTSSGNPTRLTTLGRIAQDWAAIDVGTDIQTEDPSVYFGGWDETTSETACNIYRGTFDISLYTSQLSGDPYGNYYFGYHSTQPATEAFPSGANIPRVQDPDLDAIIDNIGSKIDQAEIIEASDAFHQFVNENATEVPLYYRPEPIGISNRLGGLEKGNPSTDTKLWDVESWYIQE
jgi:peptide/nickel transport system substrate-binding protein